MGSNKEGFTVSCDSWLVTVVDREAARLNVNRSQFCVQAITRYIASLHAGAVCRALSDKYERKSK